MSTKVWTLPKHKLHLQNCSCAYTSKYSHWLLPMVYQRSREKLHVTKKIACLGCDPNARPSEWYQLNSHEQRPYKEHKKNIRTPRQRSRRKGKQSQEETWSTKKLFNMILENMSTWLPISFRLIKFPLGFSFPCGFGMLFNCFQEQVGELNNKLKFALMEQK